MRKGNLKFYNNGVSMLKNSTVCTNYYCKDRQYESGWEKFLK